MNRKEFMKYLNRDLICPHCGKDDNTLVPQHRANRGSGGSKKRNVPSNIIVMCSWFNGQIESNPEAAELAKAMGWKLNSWQSALEFPIYCEGEWYLLDDNFGRTHLPNYNYLD